MDDWLRPLEHCVGSLGTMGARRLVRSEEVLQLGASDRTSAVVGCCEHGVAVGS